MKTFKQFVSEAKKKEDHEHHMDKAFNHLDAKDMSKFHHHAKEYHRITGNRLQVPETASKGLRSTEHVQVVDQSGDY